MLTLLPGIWVAAAAAGPDATTVPRPPCVSYEQARMLPRLIRGAMQEYLARRTPADRQRIPDGLADLAGKDWPVSVTLRRNGTEVARVIRRHPHPARAAIRAALKAMRSRDLPDKVTPEALAALTVEVELLSHGISVPEERLARAVVPGWSGFSVELGLQTAYLRPSEAYRLGLGPAEMQRRCLTQLTLTRVNADLERVRRVHTSRHLLEDPDRQFVMLYRGKVPVPPEAVEADALAAGAWAVEARLVADQDTSGRYRSPAGPASPTDHLYAAWVLARRLRTGADPALHRSVQAALSHAAQSVEVDGQKAMVRLNHPADRVEATALMALTLSALSASPKASRTAAQLRRGLAEMLPAETSEPSQEPTIRALALSAIALDGKAERPPGASSDALATVRRRLTARTPATGEEVAWMIRAGAEPAKPDRSTAPARPDLLDEAGGFALAGEEPTTAATAVAAVNLAAGRPMAEAFPGAPAGLQDAQRFCHRMIYRRVEAYFAEERAAWTGAVRVRPGSAAPDVRAAAACLEALSLPAAAGESPRQAPGQRSGMPLR